MLEPYRAVLLDLYDTFAWTDWPVLRDLVCRRLGVEREELLRALSRTRPARSVGEYPDLESDWAAVLADLEVDDRGIARELASTERELMADGVHLWGDSLPTVRELRAQGVRTALVSNCSHSTRATVDRLGLEDEFDAVVLSFEVRARKPQAAIYRAALGRLGDLEASEAIFVDDQAEYCDGARALGMDTKLIVRPEGAPIDGYAPSSNGHAVISDLSQLLGSS